MKMNLKPAYRYQFGGLLKSGAVFYLIMTVATAGYLIAASRLGRNSTTNFTAYGLSFTIFMFVVGIVSIRNDIRLCLQLGVSRRTTFIGDILAAISVALILGIAGELLMGFAQYIARGIPNCSVSDLYQLIYLGPETTPTLVQHLLGALFNAGLFMAASLFGIFFSLMFWRLNKIWTVIVAIAIPFVLNGGPILLVRLGVDVSPYFKWAISSPYNFILSCLIVSALLAMIDWLLLRKANVKAAR